MSKHGFTLKETRFVKELNADVNIYFHEKSGARLMHVNADDTNKVFSVTFRTPPQNSTGVAHIIEHSVLNGSEKFPSKEPFVELLKGSLHTFLNAMTGSDWTTYPVASTNDKDFLILSEVYLDAVFFPKIIKTDEIFYQEGWHYEMSDKSDEITIKGVVYNEMKGAYSEPSRIINKKMDDLIYPDTVYKNCSGGKPENIPELSLEEFREFHAKYYHPSNSYFYLYGKMNLDEILAMIHKEALCKFDVIDIDSTIEPQALFTEPIEAECSYPILNSEKDDDKTWFAINFLLDLKNNPMFYFSFEVISHLLLKTPAAPLKNALIQSGICKDVVGGFNSNTIQPNFSVILKDCKLESKDEFKKIFFNTLTELCDKGIDKQLIDASISIKEFDLREAEMGPYPKGLVYLMYIVSEWMHDKDPISQLCYEEVLQETKISLTTNFYETLIRKFILENKHYGFVTMKPERGLVEKRENSLKKELADLKASLSDAEIEKIIDTKNKILQRQTEPDKQEDLDKIPTLSLSDINPNPEDYSFNLIKDEKNNLTLMEHDVFSNGIVYLSIYFRTRTIPQHLVQYAQLLTEILGAIHTKKNHYTQLSNLININTGGVQFELGSHLSFDRSKEYMPYFHISTKSMKPKTEKMIEILKEIMTETVFDDVARLKEIINESKSYMEMMLMNAGHAFAEKRVAAYLTDFGKFDEIINGVEYYFFLKNILENFDEKKDSIVNNLYEAYKRIFDRNQMYVSITSPQKDIDETKQLLASLYDALPVNNYPIEQYNFIFPHKNEAFILPGMVQYVAKGNNLYLLQNSSIVYNGHFDVLANYAQLDYMWNTVRVKGGAYGGHFRISYSGNVFANSYRDPNLIETLNTFDNLGKYIKENKLKDNELKKYIIGTIRRFDIPKSACMKSEFADTYYFVDRTANRLQEQRKQILNTTVNNIKNYADFLEQIMKQGCYCVFGSETKINKNSDKFESIVNVL